MSAERTEECGGHEYLFEYAKCETCNPRKYSLPVCFGLMAIGLDPRKEYTAEIRAACEAAWIGALYMVAWIQRKFPEAAEIINKRIGEALIDRRMGEALQALQELGFLWPRPN